MAPLQRGLTWLGIRPHTAPVPPRWGPQAAGSNAAPAGAGTGVSAPGGNQALDAKAVFDRLVAAGLPVTNAVPVDTSTDPDKLLGHAGGYTSRLSFTVPGGNPKADQYG